MEWPDRGDLFERVLMYMPEDDPSSVSRPAKADIIALILRANGFPAGDAELTDRIEDLNRFEFKPVSR